MYTSFSRTIITNSPIEYSSLISIKCEYLIKKAYNKVHIIAWYVVVLEFNCITFFVYNWLIIHWNPLKLIRLLPVLLVSSTILKIKFSKWYLSGDTYIFMISILFYVATFTATFLICLVHLLKYHHSVTEVNPLPEVVEEQTGQTFHFYYFPVNALISH